MNKITFLVFTFLFSLNLVAQETAITSFVLVNADTDTDILEITEGTEINLQEYLGIPFNIRANAAGSVGSVRLELSGAMSQTMIESFAPYALYGDVSGDYAEQVFSAGSYQITATPFSGSSASGSAGDQLSISFEFIDSPLQRPFITTWKTDNPGISEDNQITIPTREGETYDYKVEWGDGSSDIGVTGNITHTYDSPGTYQVSITGDFPSISFADPFNNNDVDGDKILSIDQWGDISWEYLSVAFAGCDNLDIKATDVPDFSNIVYTNAMFHSCTSLVGNESMGLWDFSSAISMTSMFYNAVLFNQDIGQWNISSVSNFTLMFGEATAFNQDLSGWNVSNAENMNGMFAGATSFDQDLAGWNVGKVTEMGGIFDQVTLSTENYDALLQGWSAQQLQNGLNFDGGNSQYCEGEEARQKLMDDFGWTITDGGKASDCQDSTAFITTWKTDNPGLSEDNQITLWTSPNYSYDFEVEWGDGTTNSNVTSTISHTYSTPGTYQIKISGTYPKITAGDTQDRDKLLSVDQWGVNAWVTMATAFVSCKNVKILASDAPNLSNATSLRAMFNGALNFNSDIGHWDTSNIENMSRMFFSAQSFNQDIGDWDTGNVTNFSLMFEDAFAFNQDLSDWDTGRVANMFGMFKNADSMNGDISRWNTGNVTDMKFMFFNADSFNQPIGEWNVNNVSDLSNMFYGATSFNQDISGWDIGVGVNMSYLFYNASSFDQDLSALDISNAANIGAMFSNSGLSSSNYDKTLIGWSEQEGLTQYLTLGADGITFCLGEAARQKLIDDFDWSITDEGKSEDCPEPRPFITTWKTDNSGTSDDNQITIPTFPGETYNYSVNWGDGSSDSRVTGDITHVYETPGTYQVAIDGVFPRIYFNGSPENMGDKEKIIGVDQWGDNTWTSMANAFTECFNLDVTTEDIPDLSIVEDISRMFAGCVRMEGNESFGEWNTTNVRNMAGLFAGNNSFNHPIGNWNTSNVTNMNSLFYYSGFNQAIGNWDVSNVTDMVGLFEFSSFNQEIGDWDVSSVTNMSRLFLMTGFNRDISKWDVSSVTGMNDMFNSALFDQDISEWDVSNVTNMRGMFAEIGGLSQVNYDAILTSWSLLQLQNGVTFDGGTSQYCEGEEARQKIIDDFGWTITDGGKAEDCEQILSIVELIVVESDIVDMEERELFRLEDGERYSWGITGLEFSRFSIQNIKANINGDVGSVKFEVSGPSEFVTQTSEAPFNLFSQGEMPGMMFFEPKSETTSYTIIATPYSKANLGGVEGESYSLSFEVYALCYEENENLFNINVLPACDDTNGRMEINVPIGVEVYSGEGYVFDTRYVETAEGTVQFSASNLAPGTYYVGINRPADDCYANYEFTIEALENCGEQSADLITATYLQGTINPEPTGPILRVEEGNRETYLKFDMSRFTGHVTEARLEMQVASDPGHGSIEVFLGSNSNWTEVGLNGGNKPTAVGTALASINGTHSLSQTKVWNLDVANLSTGEELTLIVKHSNGNDVAFASDETALAPQLIVKTGFISQPEIDSILFVKGDGNFEITDGIRLEGYNLQSVFYGPNWEFRAETDDEVKSVEFVLTGPDNYREVSNASPFALFDSENEIPQSSPWLDFGFYTLTATPYSEVGLNGIAGEIFTVNFEVKNGCQEALDATYVEVINTSSCDSSDGIAILRGPFGDPTILGGNDNTWNYDSELQAYKAIDLSPGIYSVQVGTPDCAGPIEFVVEASGCSEEMSNADLIDATYLQGARNPEPTGPILRTEEGNRETYLKFDLNGFSGNITDARLEMQVASDPGWGTVEVFLGSDSNWTETGLNGTNKPSAVGGELASISGTHSLGQIKTWNLDVSRLSQGGELTLIVKHSNGNDVAFASDETNQAPRLIVTTTGAGLNAGNSLSLSPNPASEEIAIGFEIPTQVGAVFVYDVSGKLVQALPPRATRTDEEFQMDVSELPNGMYFVRTFDADGIPYQKPMLINR